MCLNLEWHSTLLDSKNQVLSPMWRAHMSHPTPSPSHSLSQLMNDPFKGRYQQHLTMEAMLQWTNVLSLVTVTLEENRIDYFLSMHKHTLPPSTHKHTSTSRPRLSLCSSASTRMIFDPRQWLCRLYSWIIPGFTPWISQEGTVPVVLDWPVQGVRCRHETDVPGGGDCAALNDAEPLSAWLSWVLFSCKWEPVVLWTHPQPGGACPFIILSLSLLHTMVSQFPKVHTGHTDPIKQEIWVTLHWQSKF